MTIKEAIQAMLNGKKVRHKMESVLGFYMYFDGNYFKENNGEKIGINVMGQWGNTNDWEIYEEPKPKQTVVIEKWLCKGKTGGYYILEASQGWGTTCEKVKLLKTYEEIL